MSLSIGGAAAPTVTSLQFQAPKTGGQDTQSVEFASSDTSSTTKTSSPVQGNSDPTPSTGVQLSPEVVTALQEVAETEFTTDDTATDQQSEAAVALGGTRGETAETNLVKGDANEAEVAEAESGEQPGQQVATTVDSTTGGDSETARNPLNLQI